MKTFQEWLFQNHPEELDEGWKRNALYAGALGLGSMLGHIGYNQMTKPSTPATPQIQSAAPTNPAKQIQSKSVTADDASNFVGSGTTAPQVQSPTGRGGSGTTAPQVQSPTGRGRFYDMMKRIDRKRAGQRQGTDKEIGSKSVTADD